MPSPRINRRGQEEKSGRRTRLTEKSSSFHGRSEISMASQLHRPKTVPELLSYRRVVGPVSSTSLSLEARPKLTKLLLNVTIQGSLGAVHVIISPESKVGDVIVTTVRQYAKEFRRPILPSIDPTGFDLHYSQFSLESKTISDLSAYQILHHFFIKKFIKFISS